MKKVTLVLFIFAILVSCTHPLDKKFTEENRQKLIEEIKTSEQVTLEERQMVVGYMMRAAMASAMADAFSGKQINKDDPNAFIQYIPVGKTSREMIVEQKAWLAKNPNGLNPFQTNNTPIEVPAAEPPQLSPEEAAEEQARLEKNMNLIVGKDKISMIEDTYIIEIVSVKKSKSILKSGTTESANPGKSYYLAEYLITNNHTEAYDVGPIQNEPQMFDSDGNTYKSDLMSTYMIEGGWQSGNVPPKSKKRGVIVFSAPEKAQGLKIRPGMAANMENYAYKLD